MIPISTKLGLVNTLILFKLIHNLLLNNNDMTKHCSTMLSIFYEINIEFTR